VKPLHLLFLLAGWSLLAALSGRLPDSTPSRRLMEDDAARRAVNSGALGRILGEFRTSVGDMLFLKTENYLHYGVAYRSHSHEEHGPTMDIEENPEHPEEAGHDPATCTHPDHDHDHDHDHGEHGDEEEMTVIPSAARDYRGWVGHLHRQVKPWQPPGEEHRLDDGSEVIPLFRMMTLADPHYVRGYQIGAFWIRRHDPQAAMSFLQEGLEKNPDAFQLHLMKGLLHIKQARSLTEDGDLTNPTDPEQIRRLQQARRSFRTAADLMLRERPAPRPETDVADQPGWNETRENDARAAAHLALLFEERYGDPEEARKLGDTLRRAMPDNNLLRR